MDITVRVVIDPGDGGPVTSHDVATLTRGDLTTATAGLHLAEAHQIVSGIQQHLVTAQTTAAIDNVGQCESCGRPLPPMMVDGNAMPPIDGGQEPRVAATHWRSCGVASRFRLILPNLPQRGCIVGVLVKLLVQHADTLTTSGR